MQSTVRAYFGTGFDSLNIPDSPSLLSGFFFRDFPAVYIKQDRELINLKIETTWDNIKNADYVRLTPSDTSSPSVQYYFVAGLEMINDNVCNIILIEDVINSCGGLESIDFIDGWCTRLSVGSDALFENVLDESFVPAQPMIITDQFSVGPGKNEDKTYIVCTTTSILQIEDTAVDYTSEGGLTVTVPNMPSMAGKTDYSVYDPDNEDGIVLTKSISQMNTYDSTNSTVEAGITKARSLGIESTISSSYSIPNFYIKTLPTTDRILTLDTEIKKSENNLNINFLDYTPKNNKVLAKNNTITIKSIAAQNEVNYEPWEIGDKVSGLIDFITWADLTPQGTPYCRPYIYKGRPYYGPAGSSYSNLFDTGISGDNWENVPITFTQVNAKDQISSNLSLKGLDYRYNIRTNQLAAQALAQERDILNPYLQIAGGATQSIKGFGTMIGRPAKMTMGPLDTVKDYGSTPGNLRSGAGEVFNGLMDIRNGVYNAGIADLNRQNTFTQASLAEVEFAKERMQYMYNGSIVEPRQVFPYNSGNQGYIGNGFIIYRTRMSDEDIKRFDDYLTRFGYTVSEELTKEKLFTRENFNFVVANSVYVSSSNQDVTRRRREAIQALFASGIRIWHTVPTKEKLLNNPIKEVES